MTAATTNPPSGRMRLLAVAMTISFSLTSCGDEVKPPSPVRGRVFEVLNPHAARGDWQLAPMPNASVLVVWRTEISAFADSQVVCVRLRKAASATDGSFEVPGERRPASVKPSNLFVADSYVYVDGYVDVSIASGAMKFATTTKHVHLMRRGTERETALAREHRLMLERDCSPRD